jgi:hypothetical protein
MIYNKIFVFGMLTMVLTLGLVLAGCSTTNATSSGNVGDDGVPKTIIINGFNPPPAKIYRVELTGDFSGELFEFIVLAADDAKLDGQILTAELFGVDGSGKSSGKRWTGTGEYSVNIRIVPSTGKIVKFYRYRYTFNDDGIHNDVRVNIKDAVTTLAWTDFKFAWEWEVD